jgi:predicted RNA binding protein YcfA (HicA-like mRNA interferase family)
LPSDEKREVRLRKNHKGWKESDGEWLLKQYGFEERRRKPTSHREFLHPVTKTRATLYIHGPSLLPEVAKDILKQIDKSNDKLAIEEV